MSLEEQYFRLSIVDFLFYPLCLTTMREFYITKCLCLIYFMMSFCFHDGSERAPTLSHSSDLS